MKLILGILCFSQLVLAVSPDKKTLPIGLAPHEKGVLLREGPMTEPPMGPIRSLGEWELADSAITLWQNPTYVSALQQRGKLALLADTSADKKSWESWLNSQNIPLDNITIYVVPTDSIWIRDYGPWYILDGRGTLGIIDTQYNRPRPNDDVVPTFLSRALDLPLFQPGLTHTGGNYYSDGLGNAFSSTLVFRENSSLPKNEVLQRMKDYLGIERYTTSKLAPGITIEHLDTFGKLVAPDTWVFSDFPEGSRYRNDSETMVALLKTLKSPYGTPYKIHRLKMTPISGSGENYRAYLNAFISNGTLYFPTYGGMADQNAKSTFQTALPGYEILGVPAQGTEWGDSVHCRTNNFYAKDTLFVFPEVKTRAVAGKPTPVIAEVYPSPGASIDKAPQLIWEVNGNQEPPIPMKLTSERFYEAEIPAQPAATQIDFYISASDSRGKIKTAPIRAPEMKISFAVAP